MYRLTLTTLFAALTLSACAQDDAPIHMQDAEGDEFRQGLITTDDIAMEFNTGNTRQQALEGQVSVIAALTADSVISTNAWVFAHIQLMRAISLYPPTLEEENARVWEGEDKGNFYRVRIEREDREEGTHFTYSFHGRLASEPAEDLRLLLDGDILRTKLAPDAEGFGVVRFYFDNLSHLDPNSDVQGTARVAFRKHDGTRQVHNRMVNMVVPDDQQFPEFAEFAYSQVRGEGGELRWFSRGDVKNDGEPFEYVTAHSKWNADLSGVGLANAFGGSIEVDGWTLVECWGTTLHKSYDLLSVGMTNLESGDRESCGGNSDQLDPPPFYETLPNEDPEIPASL